MQKSVLHDQHDALGAKFSEFGGWSMPLQYSGIVDEHHAVRNAVGVFDVSHLGKASVLGKGALEYCNSILTNDLRKIAPGQAQYTMLCSASGGVVDDMIVYLKSDEEVFLIPNAANTAKVVNILAHGAPGGVEVVNQHRDFAVLAVQGPRSEAVLKKLGYPTDHDYMSFVLADDGVTSVCRTGYTGEHGYELVTPWDQAEQVWVDVLAAGEEFGIQPCGLGARDTLRTEMGYALCGQDISMDINPVAAGLSWAIGWKKDHFAGEAALLEIKAKGPKRRSKGILALGRGIPRPGMEVLDGEGNRIGEVTSGTFSPTLKQGIGLALIDAGVSYGDEVQVQVRNRTEAFQVVKPPFVEVGVR